MEGNIIKAKKILRDFPELLDSDVFSELLIWANEEDKQDMARWLTFPTAPDTIQVDDDLVDEIRITNDSYMDVCENQFVTPDMVEYVKNLERVVSLITSRLTTDTCVKEA